MQTVTPPPATGIRSGLAPPAPAEPAASAGEGSTPEQHSIPLSIALHLGPGLLIGALYFATLPLAQRWGLPTLVALSFAGAAVMLPLVIGGLFARRKGRDLRAAWREAVPYRTSLPWWQYLVWIPVVLFAAGAASGLLAPLGALIHDGLFPGVPAPSPLAAPVGSTGMAAFWLVVCSVALVIVVPTLEEIYFRGFLMPRLDRFKVWAPVIGTVLFALYHTWTPWHGPARIAVVLPLAYVAYRKRNLWIGIVVHMLANSGDMIAAAVQLARD